MPVLSFISERNARNVHTNTRTYVKDCTPFILILNETAAASKPGMCSPRSRTEMLFGCCVCECVCARVL